MTLLQALVNFKYMRALTLLTCTLICLAILGGGIFPFVTGLVAVLLCTAGMFTNDCHTSPNKSLLTIFIIIFISTLTLTVIPLPSSIINLTSPNISSQNQAVEQAIKDSAHIGLLKEFHPYFSISRNRSGTIRMILLIIAGLASASLSKRLHCTQKMQYLKNIVLVATILAVAGYLSQWVFPQGKKIWWTFDALHGDPVGCFINRNHFGGFLAMLCPSAMVLSINSLMKKRTLPILLWCSSFILILFAILSSLSRGAWIATLIALTVTTCLLWSSNKNKYLLASGAVLVLSLTILVALKTNTELRVRANSLANITESTSAQMRMETWRDSLRIFPDYALLGTGMNAFRMVFPQYRTSSSRKEFKHCENEYVQILVETGAIGITLITFIMLCVSKKWIANFDIRDANNAVLNIGIAGAVVAALAHACFDFAIRVPLYFITLTSLIGLVITPNTTLANSMPDDKYNKKLCAAGLFLSMLFIVLAGKNIDRMDSSDFIKSSHPDSLSKILTWSPSSWQAWYQLGNTSISSALPDSYVFGEKCITMATNYDPLNYRLWERLARVRLHMNDKSGALNAYSTLQQLRTWIKIEEIERLKQNNSQ